MKILERLLGKCTESPRARMPRKSNHIELYCDRCGKAIDGMDMGYDEETNEIYHPGNCAEMANSMKRMMSENEEEQPLLLIGYIIRQDAELMHKKGQLKQCSISDKL